MGNAELQQGFGWRPSLKWSLLTVKLQTGAGLQGCF